MSGADRGDRARPDLHLHLPHGGARAVTGVALVLHGGRATSAEPAAERQLAVLRLRPVASRLARDGSRHGLAVARLRYAVRGWNGGQRSPVTDARWALDQLRERFGTPPVALVGHSMGGRVVNYVADDPDVTTAVELAPWIESGDPTETMRGRALLVIHGSMDKMTSPRRSAEYVRRVQDIASEARYIGLRGSAHALLGRAGLTHAITSAFVLEHLYGVKPSGEAASALAADRPTATI